MTFVWLPVSQFWERWCSWLCFKHSSTSICSTTCFSALSVMSVCELRLQQQQLYKRLTFTVQQRNNWKPKYCILSFCISISGKFPKRLTICSAGRLSPSSCNISYTQFIMCISGIPWASYNKLRDWVCSYIYVSVSSYKAPKIGKLLTNDFP